MYKGGKAMQKWIILIIISVIVVLGIVIVLNVDVETDYTPETEIEDVELRKTIVTLYFIDKESGDLAKESRLIDSKDLLKSPYEYLLNLLITGPENNKYEKTIPEGTEILQTALNNGCVEISFNKAFQEANLDENKLDKALNSILNTLSELTEVNSIKVLIEGNEVEGISDVIYKNIVSVDETNNNQTSNNEINNNQTNTNLEYTNQTNINQANADVITDNQTNTININNSENVILNNVKEANLY